MIALTPTRRRKKEKKKEGRKAGREGGREGGSEGEEERPGLQNRVVLGPETPRLLRSGHTSVNMHEHE